MIRPYLQGTDQQEYLAHLIPEGGYRSMPRIVGDGVLVVGDAAQLVNAIHREGSNMAMTSGVVAAETIIEAIAAGDFTEKTLDVYKHRLLDSFVGEDLKKYKDATHHFEKYPHYFEQYIPMLNRAASQMFTVDGTSKREKQRKIWQGIGTAGEKMKIARDLFQAWRVMK
jgi:electron transfer flavoprotein-quinone oxidoreductase